MRLLDWIEAHDRHITVALLLPLIVLAVVVAGQAAIRI